MNLSDLAEKVATEHDLPKAKVKAVLESTFGKLAEAVASGEEVALPGFGKFKLSERAARQGRNPATGEVIQIAASRKPTFAPAKPLRDRLNPAA